MTKVSARAKHFVESIDFPTGMADSYSAFLARKQTMAVPVGFEAANNLSPFLKPFQRDLVLWACRRGAAAIFAGTGLGKTLQQLSWARQVVDHTGGRVIILAPLAVALQTVGEAEKFDIPGVAYAADESQIASDIVVTNYDRRHLFDLSQFAGIVLDESSIIKSHDGKTRAELMETAAEIPYKLCCTATPAPNDWTELGQHAEFLGVMSAKEMLAMFFVHEGSVRANPNGEEWRLKRHAENDFWRWVSSWAVMLRSPIDLGYDEPEYILPPLNLHQITVAADYRPTAGMLFPVEARTMQERRAVKKDSIDDRVLAVAHLVNSQPDRPWLVWCDLNAEGEALAKALSDSLEVAGSHSPDLKTIRLLGFVKGNPRVLVTKPKIGGWGMNWAHCADMVFVGLNDSFESLFQSIRRCWRFGQTKPVNVYLVASEFEGAVVANLKAKEQRYDRMAEAMVDHMRGFSEAQIRGGRQTASTYEPKIRMELPTWMTA
jgi:hypothetical protein